LVKRIRLSLRQYLVCAAYKVPGGEPDLPFFNRPQNKRRYPQTILAICSFINDIDLFVFSAARRQVYEEGRAGNLSSTLWRASCMPQPFTTIPFFINGSSRGFPPAGAFLLSGSI